jgi:dolichyl-phosphate-mannose-protein mannosyltransferase
MEQARLSAARWTWLDTLLITVLTALAGALRFRGISSVRDMVFDEFYAGDACLYVFGPSAYCSTTSEISVAHPPLGKWLIGIGIRLFGFTPGGWRLAPLIAGTLSVAILYLLARRLLGSTLAASIATGLLTFDFLHFVMSRTAMLDIFVLFFGLASFLCLVYDRDRDDAQVPASRSRLLQHLRERRWLLGAGLAGGAAIACKWSGVYLLAAVAVVALMYGAASRQEEHRYWRFARDEGALLLIAFVLLPAVVYVVSYAGNLDGRLLAWPWQHGSWARAFVARQQQMLEHHLGALYTHPYTSPAWSWWFIKRPVLFYFRDLGRGDYREILAIGNPLVWWLGLLAIATSTWRLLRRRSVEEPDTIIVTGFVAGYIPWLLVTRQEAFLYYLLPAVPFLCLALAHMVCGISARGTRAIAVGGLVVASIGMFSFFRPILVGSGLSYREWERRIWFRDCSLGASDVPMKPVNRQVPPPAGWCWI